MEQNQVFLKSQETNLLFKILDINNKGYLEFEDFLRIIDYKKTENFKKNSKIEQLKPEIINLVVEFLLICFEDAKNSDTILRELSKNIDSKEGFKKLDHLEKGYLDIRDIYDFMTNYIEDFTFTMATKIMLKLTRSKEKKLCLMMNLMRFLLRKDSKIVILIRKMSLGRKG